MGQLYMPILQVSKFNHKTRKIKSETFAFNFFAKLTEIGKETYHNNLIADMISEYYQKGWRCFLTFAGEYATPNPLLKGGLNLYGYYRHFNEKKQADIILTDHKTFKVNGKKEYELHIDVRYKYIVNFSKEEYYVVSNNNSDYSSLALLTADGNNPGNGGDYKYKDVSFVGRWKGDEIAVSDTFDIVEREIKNDLKFKNSTRWKEITPNFENY